MNRNPAIGSLPLLEGGIEAPPPPFGPTHRYSARQIWHIIRRHELLLAAIVSVTMIVVLISQLTATPIYQAVSAVQVVLNDEKGMPDAAARNHERVTNEAELFGSRSLAERVVKDLKLVHDPRFTQTPLPRNESPTPAHVLGATGTLMSMTRVTPERNSDFIRIAVQSPSADLAAEIANQYSLSLTALRAESRDAKRNAVVRDLEGQRNRLAANARQAEQALADFRRANQMLAGAGGEEDLQQINRIAIEAASANAMRAAQGARAAGISSAVSHRSTAGASSALLDQQQRRLDELVRERSDLSSVYGAQHPRIQSIDAQISVTQSNLAREEQNVIAAASARASADAAKESGLARSEAAAASARSAQLQSQLRQMIGKAYANTANSVELNALDRQAQAAREAFLATAKLSEEARSSIDAEGVHSSLVSPAATPKEPISPRPKSATFAAFTGSLLLGLLLIAAIELSDNRLWNAEQVTRHFGIPTFAMLPDLGQTSKFSAERNPVLQDPSSLFAEVSRGFAEDVGALPHPDRTQTVLITSPLMGDGKSTVAITLAAAAAAAGRRSLVLDLDLRAPSGPILQSDHPTVGGIDLVDYLKGTGDLVSLLPSPERIDASAEEEGSFKPMILSAREPVRNPASVMRMKRVNRLIDELHQEYDLIVINAPAALATSDARMLTKTVDTTLIVLRWGRTTVEQVRATAQVLHDQVDGAVFNRVDYPEHARRGYGDSVQYYMDSAAYYSGPIPTRSSWRERFTAFWTRSSADEG